MLTTSDWNSNTAQKVGVVIIYILLAHGIAFTFLVPISTFLPSLSNATFTFALIAFLFFLPVCFTHEIKPALLFLGASLHHYRMKKKESTEG